MERQELEKLLADGWSLARIARHVGRDPSTVSYWMRKYSLQPPDPEPAARRGPDREELEALVLNGCTIAEIAERLTRSKASVRHWMKRYGLRSLNRTGRRPANAFDVARQAGATTAIGSCPRHGMTEFTLERGLYFRCKACRVERVTRRRRLVKETLVAEAGGRCCICGYDRHPAALQFHHLDPAQKTLAVSKRVLSLDALRAETRKCVLLCATCHAEVEAGVTQVPLK
jgi:transposase